jgi:hypothetical protein
VIFSSIFRAFKTIFRFYGIVSGIKNKFGKKRKPILADWAEPVGPTLPTGPASRPAEAHWGPAEPARPVKAVAFTAGGAATPTCVPRRRFHTYLRWGHVSSRAAWHAPSPVSRARAAGPPTTQQRRWGRASPTAAPRFAAVEQPKEQATLGCRPARHRSFSVAERPPAQDTAVDRAGRQRPPARRRI